MLKGLPEPDIKHLTAATGWLELGNWQEAFDELERITPQWRAHPDVLVKRCEVYSAAWKWDYALAIAEGLTECAPTDPRGWLWLCRIFHFTGRNQQAYDIATSKVADFRESWELHYDTACYASLLGKFKEAEDFLTRAFALGDAKKLKLMALNDPDLERLWKEIGKL